MLTHMRASLLKASKYHLNVVKALGPNVQKNSPPPSLPFIHLPYPVSGFLTKKSSSLLTETQNFRFLWEL